MLGDNENNSSLKQSLTGNPLHKNNATTFCKSNNLGSKMEVVDPSVDEPDCWGCCPSEDLPEEAKIALARRALARRRTEEQRATKTIESINR